MAPSPSQVVRRMHAKRQDLSETTTATRTLNTATGTTAATTTAPPANTNTNTRAATTTAAPAGDNETTTTRGGGLLDGVIGGVTSVISDVTSVVGGINTSLIPTTTSSTSTTTPPNTPTPPPVQQESSSSTSVYLTTSADQVITVTSVVAVTASSETPSPTEKPPPKSFLQNKPLSGTVFALCGVVGLVVIISIATMALRKSKRNRFNRELEAELNRNDGLNDFSGTSEKPYNDAASSNASSRRGSNHSEDGLISFIGNKANANSAAAASINSYPYRDTPTPAPTIASTIPRGQTPQPNARSFTPAPPGIPPNVAYAPPPPAHLAAYNVAPQRALSPNPNHMMRATSPAPMPNMNGQSMMQNQWGPPPPMNDPYGVAPHEMDYSRAR